MSTTTSTTTVYQGAPAPRLPIGVAILAVLSGIFGFIVLVVGLLVLLVSLFGVSSFGWATAYGTGAIAGLIILIVGVVILSVASGLWDQELWALVIAIIVTGVAVLWFVFRPLYDGYGVASIENVPAIFSAVLFVYLLAVSNDFW
jgi:hypothetical protein